MVILRPVDLLGSDSFVLRHPSKKKRSEKRPPMKYSISFKVERWEGKRNIDE